MSIEIKTLLDYKVCEIVVKAFDLVNQQPITISQNVKIQYVKTMVR